MCPVRLGPLPRRLLAREHLEHHLRLQLRRCTAAVPCRPPSGPPGSTLNSTAPGGQTSQKGGARIWGSYPAFLYLAVVLDAWSRRVVGWSMAGHLRSANSSSGPRAGPGARPGARCSGSSRAGTTSAAAPAPATVAVTCCITRHASYRYGPNRRSTPPVPSPAPCHRRWQERGVPSVRLWRPIKEAPPESPSMISQMTGARRKPILPVIQRRRPGAAHRVWPLPKHESMETLGETISSRWLRETFRPLPLE